MEVIDDPAAVTPEELSQSPHAERMTLEDCLPLLAAPDSKLPLRIAGGALTDGAQSYELRDGLPLLVPALLRPYFDGHLAVPFERAGEGYFQYFLFATIKQTGEINAPSSSLPYHRHIHRVKGFMSEASGITLDVGCDDPALSASFLPEGGRYVGLDPFCLRTEPFRVIGFGEALPFRSASIDNVLFNTSLDHIMDWHLALEEAERVLKPGGSLYLTGYVWTERADLLRDTVHFHHFRDYELLGKLGELGLKLERDTRYACPKGDSHRHEMFVRAVKPR